MSSWTSYPSIFNLGHRAVRDLLNHPHIIEEKVDGSQFSFGYIETAEGVMHSEETGVMPFRDYSILVRSKGAVMITDAPEKMFNKAVETAKRICSAEARMAGVGAHPGWTYRCEYLAKPSHGTLIYDRVPSGFLIGFDISTGDNEWLGQAAKVEEFKRIGLECVPLLAWDSVGGRTTLDTLRRILDTTTSVLGGQLVEGIVVKPIGELYGYDKKTLLGKFVAERFKEAHVQVWKEKNPNSGDILERLTKTYKLEARWMKAIQHLREAPGGLQDAPQDIPKLLEEIQRDLGQECKAEIQKMLWKWAWPHVARNITRGFPEYYKDVLLKRQFEQAEEFDDTMDALEHAAMLAEGCPNHD